MTPEQFVDGLNSAIHGTRGRDFPNKKDLRMRLVPETEWHEKKPVVQHFWKGVVAPHDGFTGLVTGYKYKIKDAQKDLKRFSGERPSSPYPNIPEGAGTQQGELSAVGEPSQVINNAMVHDSSTLRKGLLPLFAGGAGAAAMALGEAQAAIPADQYRFPADEPGWVNPEPPLETPLFSPIDLALAPAGVAKASGKVAAVAAEPFVAWGMDKAVDWLGEAAAPALRQAAGGFVEAAAPGIAQSWGWMGNAAGGLLEHFQQESD